MDLELARQVLAVKALARRNQTRRNRIRLVGLLLGTALGAVWFLVAPLSSSKPGSEFAIAAVGGFFLTDILIQLCASTLFPKRARCPCCGHDWEIREGRVMALEMPTWDKCPGCGLMMSDLSLFLILKRSES